MKALTIRQPWASLIALGIKTIETRSWKAPDALIGQRIAIHAGAQTGGWGRRGTRTETGDYEIERDASGLLLRGPIEWPYRLPLSAVVCTAVLAECLPMVEPTAPLLAGRALVLDEDMLYIRTCAVDNPIAYGGQDVERERPYGHFEPGRWGWLLTDIKPIAPVPAKGRLGFWEWTQ